MKNSNALNNQTVVQENLDTQRGVALIVDDDNANRLILSALLKEQGFSVIEAANGAEAVSEFALERPDIVFMDVKMPVMDGLEATRRIKILCKDQFVPVIFLTAISDETSLAECITAGGDDFLTKPYSNTILKARIRSQERSRDQNRQIQTMYDQRVLDEARAIYVYNQSVTSQNVVTNVIQSLLKPVEHLSGDILLSTHTPSNDVYILLGNFTGHGLAAGLGAIITSDAFHKMGGRGLSPGIILNEVNEKLHRLLPTDMFMAIQFIAINHNLSQITVYNCGMPDILHISEYPFKIINKISSSCTPLGVNKESDYHSQMMQYPITRGDRIVLVNDGMLEARNETNDMYGQDRFEAAVVSTTQEQSLIESITLSHDVFVGNQSQLDNLSLVDIPCVPEILPIWSGFIENDLMIENHNVNHSTPDARVNKFGFRVELEGVHLQKAEPVPLILREIKALINTDNQDQPLFVILSELYINALDHGVLKLDSSLKNNAEGFIHYFNERETRLNTLDCGHVIIDIVVYKHPVKTRLVVTVMDSGEGFDHHAKRNVVPSASTLHGRGMMLVRELCESIEYQGNGNHVVAIYTWDD